MTHPALCLKERPFPLELLSRLDMPVNNPGLNRNTQGVCHIQADSDIEAIQCWLAEFVNSPQTFRNYRKEAERLLLWSTRHLNKNLSSLTREDFMAYQVFLADPQPVSYWCGPRIDRCSENWRPFEGPLRASSQKQALIVINSLFAYLVDAGYLVGNPLSLIRRRHKTLTPDTQEGVALERFLDHETWEHLKSHIQGMPRKMTREIATYERIRFLFHLLYLLAPRVSEVASHTMNSFREYRGKWWWFVTGKGNKKAKVPVSDEMLDALMRYRRFLKISDLPAEDDSSPLLRSISGTQAITANMVYKIVKATVISAADSLEEIAPHKAAKLRQASVHWFRHTGISHQDDAGVRLKYLQKNARHEKQETTAIYQHAEDELWHAEAQKHRF